MYEEANDARRSMSNVPVVWVYVDGIVRERLVFCRKDDCVCCQPSSKIVDYRV
jgi:hypothetical protein